MKRIIACIMAVTMLLTLSVGAFASGEASGGPSGGPASLTREQSAELSRSSAAIWQEAGNASYTDRRIVSKDDDFTAIFAEGGSLTVADSVIFTSGREARSPNTTMHFADANFYGTAAAVLAGQAAGDSGIGMLTVGEGCEVVLPAGAVATVNGTAVGSLLAGTYDTKLRLKYDSPCGLLCAMLCCRP